MMVRHHGLHLPKVRIKSETIENHNEQHLQQKISLQNPMKDHFQCQFIQKLKMSKQMREAYFRHRNLKNINYTRKEYGRKYRIPSENDKGAHQSDKLKKINVSLDKFQLCCENQLEPAQGTLEKSFETYQNLQMRNKTQNCKQNNNKRQKNIFNISKKRLLTEISDGRHKILSIQNSSTLEKKNSPFHIQKRSANKSKLTIFQLKNQINLSIELRGVKFHSQDHSSLRKASKLVPFIDNKHRQPHNGQILDIYNIQGWREDDSQVLKL